MILHDREIKMDNIRESLKLSSKLYNKNIPHLNECLKTIYLCHEKLKFESNYCEYGYFHGANPILYNVFSLNNSVSRPVRPDIYISDTKQLEENLLLSHKALSRGGIDLSNKEIISINRIVYTSVMSVACCFDLWQRGSRKTPGTFFEFFMAALLKTMLPNQLFSKHIPLGNLLGDIETTEDVSHDASNEDEEDGGTASVSTDLVIGSPHRSGGLVIPLKITTRERIVQPFAHQRILNAAFGNNAYQSLLVCISETQLDDKTRSVKQVCVPGTVKLFQKYLSPISGLYYCDIPQRYSSFDIQNIIPVKNIGDLFRDISNYFHSHN